MARLRDAERIEGRRTNGIPISAMPERPGFVALLGYTLWLIAVVAATIPALRWAGSKASRGVVAMKP